MCTVVSMSHMDDVLMGQISIVLLSNHMARTLTTTHESVKTQTGLFILFNSFITARKAECSSAHQANLFLPALLRVEAF